MHLTGGTSRVRTRADGTPMRRAWQVAVALGLAAGPAIALGLARFAYALLLPAMRASLHWSFVTAALMNTANAAGYLLGALTAAWAARAVGARRAFLGGLVVVVASLLISAASGDLGVLLGLRAVAGAAGAVSFIVGAALTAQLGAHERPQRSALLLGVYFGGGGLGIAVSGIVLPAVLTAGSPTSGWRWGWITLGVLGAVAAAAAVPAARSAPQPAATDQRTHLEWRPIANMLAAYTLYGAGYIAYMTFVVALLTQDGMGATAVSAFWILLGVAAIAGGFAWGRLIGRLRGGGAAGLLMALVAVGALLPLLGSSPVLALTSAALFGASFLAVVAAVTQAARDALSPAHWTAAVAILTTGFALGQCIGPVLSGVLADNAAGVRSGMLLSVAILALASVVALTHRTRPGVTPRVRRRRPRGVAA